MNLEKRKKRIDSFSLHKNNDFLFKEKERILVRWVIVAIIFYLLFETSQEAQSNKFIITLSLFATTAYIIINTVRFLLIYAHKTSKNPYMFLYSDIAIVCSALYVIPDKSTILHTVILFLIISTGMNYGYKAMLTCNSLAIFMFTCAVIGNQYWQNNMNGTLSVYLTVILIPYYLTSIIKNLELSTYHLNERAYKDYLTGLYNRTTIYKKLKKTISNTKNTNVMSALFYFDLDNFKLVNDQFGHKIGDALLVSVATNLQRTFRDKDLIFRIGGDEFIVIAEGVWSKEDAEIIANKILESVVSAVDQIGISVKVTSSIGIICIKPEQIDLIKDIKSYITLADKAMYEAKKAGKSQYVFAN